jgi:predicted transcriptional regulator
LRHRTRTDILAQVIEVAKGKPVTKTRIAYDCFLSYDLLQEYLDVLINCDLLKFDKANQTYVATKRGIQYLDLCTTLQNYANINNETNSI